MIFPEIKPLDDGRLEVITSHINADFDAVASMIAAGKLYPNAVMVFPGSQEKNIRNFYIQSVIYLFQVAKLKELDLSKVGRLILVDTRLATRIGPLEKVLDNPDLEIHIYDHHPDTGEDLRGQLEIVTEVGANVTLMTEILSEKKAALTPEEATVLALGIYEDTGSFSYSSTTPRDYRAAALLLEQGADLSVVSEMISRELTIEQVSLLHDLIKSAQTHTINDVEVVIVQASSERYIDEVAVLVHKIMDMKSIDAIFALVLMENRVQLVARSRVNQVDVGSLARQLGGGGHPTAAAATIKDMTLPQAAGELLRLLKNELGPVRTARDIMAFPVISISSDATVSDARQKFTRYDVNTLIVTDDRGEMLGYISRQNVAKALYHGLPGYAVNEFVTSEFGVVSPDASFRRILSLIIEQKQQVVPVVEKGRPIGVITRTDLLNILTNETKVPGSLVEVPDGALGGRTKKILGAMREHLPRDVLDLLANIGRQADELGYAVFAVGGFVRDILLRQENLDIDVVIEGDGIHFAHVFALENPGVRVRQHKKFSTAVMIFPDGLKVDVTTARLEYYESPGALPVVEKGSIRLDLYRRDFTINTLAVSLNPKDFGTVIDYFRGLRDIKDGFIRVLHNLSFVEDPTRVFRAVRFEQRFGFKIGKMTAALIVNAVKHDFFSELSGKRLSTELSHILQEDEPGPAVVRLSEFDLLKFVHPALSLQKEMMDLFRRIKKVRDWFSMTFPEERFESWLIYFLGLLNHLSKQQLAETALRLSIRKYERRVLVEEKPLVDDSMYWLKRQRDIRSSDLYTLLSPLSTESILFMMARADKDHLSQALVGYLTKLRYIKTELSGKDLIKMGYEPGPLYKKILDALHAARLNEELETKEDEKKYVRQHYPSS